jgi:predicted DNA-binding transcriptional regulator AlpA
MDEKILSPTEVAELLGVTSAALTQMRYLGRGPDYLRLSAQRIRYRRSDVDAWLERRRVELGDGAK